MGRLAAPRASVQAILQMSGSHHSHDDSYPANLLLGHCFPNSVDSKVQGPRSRVWERLCSQSFYFFLAIDATSQAGRANNFLCQSTMWSVDWTQSLAFLFLFLLSYTHALLFQDASSPSYPVACLDPYLLSFVPITERAFITK